MLNYNFNWSVIWRNRERFFDAWLLGLELAVISLVIASMLGLLLAYARQSRWPWLRAFGTVYVELFRNLPLLLLVFFLYFGLPELGIRILDKYHSFVLTLSIYGAAYMCEAFRAGLASMPPRYVEAAQAIGLTPWQRQRYVVLPVMFRITLPAISNNLISLFKDTSIAAAIAVPEITFTARQVNANTFRVMEAWLTATALYLVTAYVLAIGLRLVERRYAVVR